jgi:required for meiotic nuclear division protein 1
MFKVSASQISNNIDIDSFAAVCSYELLHSDHTELFYEVDTELYVSVFRYGVVCFFNYDEIQVGEFINLISNHCTYFDDSELTKEYLIDPQSEILRFGVKKAEFTYFDIETLRVVMLNLAQSVALNYYFQNARILLGKTNKHTSSLEKNGKLDISDKELKKFIGKTHNLKNEIVENLHVFDMLSDVHQNEYLVKVDTEMKATLFMEKRFSNIYRELETIREHLEYFSDLTNHGSSMKLEWIVIVLLAIFVLNIIVSHFQ